jgi:hypothetical protein
MAEYKKPGNFDVPQKYQFFFNAFLYTHGLYNYTHFCLYSYAASKPPAPPNPHHKKKEATTYTT